jgi:UDP-galactopyranose mutase
LARRLSELGIAHAVLERNEEAGGLCRTLRSGEYSWDLGPHGLYSKRAEAMAFCRALPLKYERLRRNVRICHHGPRGIREVGYPFENGLADLPFLQKIECVVGYCRAARAPSGRAFGSVQEWIESGLGPGIARYFMLPYNRKIWDCPLDRMSMDLVKEKIDPERPWTIVRNAFWKRGVGRAYQAEFLYPEDGIGALPKAVASSLRGTVRTGFRVSRILPLAGRWRVLSESGDSLEADRVVSTIPLPELLQALDEPSLGLKKGAFLSNHTWFVVVGLKPGRDFGRFKHCQWVFFAGPEIFYRISLMHNFTRKRPAAAVAEITCKGEAAALRQDELASRVLKDMKASGILCDEEDAAVAQAHLERYTYPIQSVGMRAVRDEVEEALRLRGIFLLGRSGRWDYLNMDGIFLAVSEFVEKRLPAVLGR